MSLSGVFSSGKVAVITGGADGIGLACAKKLLGLGLQVCISDNNEEKLQEVSEQLPDLMAVPADVSQIADIEHLRDTVYARFGGDLINNRPALSRWHPHHERAFQSYMHDPAPDDGEPPVDSQ